MNKLISNNDLEARMYYSSFNLLSITISIIIILLEKGIEGLFMSYSSSWTMSWIYIVVW